AQIICTHIASRRAVLVLCLNLYRRYTFHCRRKVSGPRTWLGFLVNVWFWSALTLTLNQRVRRRGPKLTSGCVEATLPRTDSVTLLQLCQNYMSLCVRIG